jgi:hypothetical protein
MTLAQRQDARAAVSGPGKFEGEHPMVPILYERTLSGWEDEWADFGSDGFVSYYSRIGRWVLYHDDQGFIYGYRFDSVADAAGEITRLQEVWDREERKQREQAELDSDGDPHWFDFYEPSAMRSFTTWHGWTDVPVHGEQS